MAHHESVINAFIHVGLRQKELQNILASNVVLDWFGRTLSGKQRVVDFYLNSNNLYEHNITNINTTQPFENRSTHITTRKEPEENFERSSCLSSDEQWYDCEAQSSIDLKESHRTPPKKSTTSVNCPPAPCRRFLVSNSSDEEIDSNSDEDVELGIYPLDGLPEIIQTKIVKSSQRNLKRLRLEKKEESDNEANITEQTTMERESNYSELYYIESTGTVTTFRQGSSSTSRNEDIDRRECKLFISYRLNKDNHDDIQIALIVYKLNNTNQKSRRNLIIEFDDQVSESDVSLTPSITRCCSVIKENPKILDNISGIINTAPAGSKPTKGTKRPMMSRNRLRF